MTYVSYVSAYFVYDSVFFLRRQRLRYLFSKGFDFRFEIYFAYTFFVRTKRSTIVSEPASEKHNIKMFCLLCILHCFQSCYLFEGHNIFSVKFRSRNISKDI